MKHVLGPDSRTTLTGVLPGDSQPNAVDLRLGKVFSIQSNDFVLTNNNKKHRGTVEMFPDADGFFVLQPGSYEVVMENIVHVGAGEAGWVITRSTLNRNGCFLTSGLYDSGYHGAMAAVLHVTSGRALIKQGTRIGQYLSFNSEAIGAYDGDYGLDKSGQPKPMEAKYHD